MAIAQAAPFPGTGLTPARSELAYCAAEGQLGGRGCYLLGGKVTAGEETTTGEVLNSVSKSCLKESHEYTHCSVDFVFISFGFEIGGQGPLNWHFPSTVKHVSCLEVTQIKI